MRTDSNNLYVYDEEQDNEKKIISFDMQIDDGYYFDSYILSGVRLELIDSMSVFDETSVNYLYSLDGIMLRQIMLSNKFGPISPFISW